jgi:hypothetical protein
MWTAYSAHAPATAAPLTRRRSLHCLGPAHTLGPPATLTLAGTGSLIAGDSAVHRRE